MRRNADITVNRSKGKFRDEHFNLYQRYITSRHNEIFNLRLGRYHVH